MKKVAKPVHAVIGTLGKRARVPLTEKDVAGATSELRCALTCLKTTGTISTAIPTARISIEIPTAKIATAKKSKLDPENLMLIMISETFIKSKLGPEINTIIIMISIPTIVLVAGVLMVVADALQRTEKSKLDPEINIIIIMISIPTLKLFYQFLKIVLVAGVLMVVADALQRTERKALEVILELHAWIDAKDVGTTRWIAKGDVNRKKVCRVVAVMSTATAITMATEIITDTEISTATEITMDTEISMATEITTDTEISMETEITTDTEITTATEISMDTEISTATTISTDTISTAFQ